MDEEAVGGLEAVRVAVPSGDATGPAVGIAAILPDRIRGTGIGQRGASQGQDNYGNSE